MTISDEAVEAAKEAMREVTPPPGISKADWLARYGDFALIAGAIAAAAPHLAAQAWGDGYATGECDVVNDVETETPNPYRSQDDK